MKARAVWEVLGYTALVGAVVIGTGLAVGALVLFIGGAP